MNKAASDLGKLAKGIPKTITADERKQRAKRAAEARKHRWPTTKKGGRPKKGKKGK